MSFHFSLGLDPPGREKKLYMGEIDCFEQKSLVVFESDDYNYFCNSQDISIWNILDISLLNMPSKIIHKKLICPHIRIKKPIHHVHISCLFTHIIIGYHIKILGKMFCLFEPVSLVTLCRWIISRIL